MAVKCIGQATLLLIDFVKSLLTEQLESQSRLLMSCLVELV